MKVETAEIDFRMAEEVLEEDCTDRLNLSIEHESQ